MDTQPNPPPPLQLLQSPRRRAAHREAPLAPPQPVWWLRWLDWRAPAAR